MKNLFKLLAILLLFTAFVTCSDDDDDSPVVINDIMVVYNSDTGMFSSIDLTDGTLTPLGTVTYNGSILTGLRDMVYNPDNATLYMSSRSDYNNGAIFSINPSTLEAIIINDNADDDWYALPGLEMANGKLLGTVYWDEFEDDNNLNYYTGLVALNLDGTIADYNPLMYEGDEYNFSDGMAIDYGATMNELYIADDEDIMITDLNGNISDIIEMSAVGMPDMDDNTDGLRTFESDENGVLYAIDRDSHFGRVNLTTGVFTYIATLSPEDDKHVALSLIPENIFN